MENNYSENILPEKIYKLMAQIISFVSDMEEEFIKE